MAEKINDLMKQKIDFFKLIAVIFIVINLIIFVFSIANLFLFNPFSGTINNIGYYSKELNNMSLFDRIYVSYYKIISIMLLIFNIFFLFSSIGLFLNKKWAKKLFIINLIVSLIFFIFNIINQLIYIFKGPPILNESINDFYKNNFHINFDVIYILTRLGFIFILLFLTVITAVLIILFLKKLIKEK